MNTRPLLCIILFSSAALCFGPAPAAEPSSAAGSTAGSTTAEGTTAEGTTAGGATAGGATAEGTTAGGATAGGATAAGVPAASASGPPTPGSWQKHQYTFQFMGFTSTFSCDGLADKLKVLLLAAGARADVKSQPGVCAAPLGRPDKFARADLTFYTLAPLAADAAESGEKPVSGGWRAVSFANQMPRGLQIGDCEVVEQFRTNLLPMFTARNIVDQTTCIPYQESGSVINLRFEVFAPPPRRAAKR